MNEKYGSANIPVVVFAVFLPVIVLSSCGGGGGGSSGQGAPFDSSTPTVSVTSPANGADNVPVNSALGIVFSGQVDQAVVTVTGPLGAIPVMVTCSGSTAIVEPTQEFTTGTQYVVVIRAGPNLVLVNYPWIFTTDASVPVLRGTITPDNGFSAMSLSGVTVRDVRISDNLTDVVSENSTASGAAGRYSFASTHSGYNWVIAEKTFASGTIHRLLGVARIYSDGATPAKKDILASDVTAQPAASLLVAFCNGCHRPYYGVSSGNATPGCTHSASSISGAVPDPARVHPPSHRLDDYGRITCESCHLVHYPTGYSHFVTGDPHDGNWCNKCHGS